MHPDPPPRNDNTPPARTAVIWRIQGTRPPINGRMETFDPLLVRKGEQFLSARAEERNRKTATEKEKPKEEGGFGQELRSRGGYGRGGGARGLSAKAHSNSSATGADSLNEA